MSPFSPAASQTGVVDLAHAAVTDPRRHQQQQHLIHHHHRHTQHQQQPQRFVNELGTLLASGVSTDDTEEASPLSLDRHRYGEIVDDDDEKETSALQAILNASGSESPSTSSQITEISPRQTTATTTTPTSDPLLPPPAEPHASALLHIPGLEHDADADAADASDEAGVNR